MIRPTLFLFAVLIAATESSSQTADLQKGIKPFGNMVYCARPNGDVYRRSTDQVWNEPPAYIGNFWFGDPVPADFVEGFHWDGGYLMFYVSAGGDLYRQDALNVHDQPNYEGNFFPGQPVPPDFRSGFHMQGAWYISSSGDVYRQITAAGPWSTPQYLGNFLVDAPVSTSKSTIGSVKSKYKR